MRIDSKQFRSLKNLETAEINFQLFGCNIEGNIGFQRLQNLNVANVLAGVHRSVQMHSRTLRANNPKPFNIFSFLNPRTPVVYTSYSNF